MSEAFLQDNKFRIFDITSGHVAECLFPVRNLLILKSFTFEYFHTNCQNIPTTWSFSVTYQQIPETGKVGCLIILHRTDSSSGDVGASVSVSYVDALYETIRAPKLICRGQMSSGGEMQGLYTDSMYPGYVSYVLSLQLCLKVTIFIRYCHNETQPPSEESVLQFKNKITRSKL